MIKSLIVRPGSAGTPAVVAGPGFPKIIAAALTAARQRPSDQPHLVTTTTHGSPPSAKATLWQPGTISATAGSSPSCHVVHDPPSNRTRTDWLNQARSSSLIPRDRFMQVQDHAAKRSPGG